MSDKSVETLGVEIRFWSVLETTLLLPRNNIDFSFVITLHRPQLRHNIEFFRRRGRGYQRVKKQRRLNIEVSFAGSVSATFVAHCSFHVRTIAGKPATDLWVQSRWIGCSTPKFLHCIEIGSNAHSKRILWQPSQDRFCVYRRVNISVNISETRLADSGS